MYIVSEGKPWKHSLRPAFAPAHQQLLTDDVIWDEGKGHIMTCHATELTLILLKPVKNH